MTGDMRIAFMGTPEFAVPTLDALLEAGHEVAAVYSQPPRPAGRGKAMRLSPVQTRAEAAGIEARTPASLKGTEEQAAFRALDLDTAVVAAYGLILPVPILEAPRFGCLNVHASILPRWRGAAPIQRAILAGDEKTGITIMGMERGLDTGPIYAIRETEVGGKTAGELSDELAGIGGALLVEVLVQLPGLVPTAQPEQEATYAAKTDKAEARIDFNQPAEAVERQIRAFNPAPGAFFERGGERIKILAASVFPGGSQGPDVEPPTGPRLSPGRVVDDKLTIACGVDAIRPTLVQRAGRAAMTPAELLRGFDLSPGTRLG